MQKETFHRAIFLILKKGRKNPQKLVFGVYVTGVLVKNLHPWNVGAYYQ
jgi:hypothetical protein